MTTTSLSETVSYRLHGAIAEAVIDNPPVNALSASVRDGLLAAVQKAEGDAAVSALVITCAGRTFVAGADIREFGKPMTGASMNDVLEAMDNGKKPIVAALHGTVLGGGLELALVAHYRVAVAGTRFGFPEVKLGIVPGAGGTQRTPRLTGLATAIRLLIEGNQIGADEALGANLIDQIAQGSDHSAAAIDFACELVAQGKGPRRSRDLPMPADDPALFDATRKSIARKMRGQTAPLRILDAIRLGYETDFATGLVRELEICKESIAGPQSKALRHMFMAEREVARIPGLPADTAKRPVASVGVVGLGQMGRGIVMAVAGAGIPVVAVGREQADLDAGMKGITKLWSGSVAKGSLSQASMDERLARITPTLNIGDLSGVDLVIEAVTEDMATKQEVFAALARATKPGAILASNTSYLDIDALADAAEGAQAGRAADVCGMHFFNPANVMRLLENVRAHRTAPEVVATIMDFGKRIGKLPVLSGVCDGFIVNRMLAKRTREAFFLLEDGASPAAIDGALTGFGFPMGPLALGDLAGLDIVAAVRAGRRHALTPRELRADFVEQMVAAGRLGQKSGAGWYRYDENRKASADPATDEMVAAHAKRHGLTLRQVGDDEIRERLLYVMINEGAKILGEGIAPRPHEIDVALVNGLGWPAYTGGPMFLADQIGLDKVLAAIERFAGQYEGDTGAAYWSPAPLLVQYAREGRGFYQ